jgi:Vault protein inter-alpha-trypsin domain
MECIYHFPLDDNAAICGFQASYEDGRVVEGKVKEKHEAAAEYKRATRQGKQANLLQQIKPDLFSLKVGNLPPGQYVNITLTYVTTLEARGDAPALVVPTCVAPRYTPSGCDLSPVEAATIPSDMDLLFGLAINTRFTCKSNILSITSPTPSGAGSIQGCTGSFQLRNLPLDRDLVILCEEEKSHQPSPTSQE